jgi:hypothetical protein
LAFSRGFAFLAGMARHREVTFLFSHVALALLLLFISTAGEFVAQDWRTASRANRVGCRLRGKIDRLVAARLPALIARF